MRLSTATNAVATVIRNRPGDFFPVYMLGAAVPVIARTVAFFGLAVIYLYLEVSGRLETFRTELAALDVTIPDPDAEPEAFEAAIAELAPAFEAILTPTTVLVLLLTILVMVLVGVLSYAVVSAAQLSTCYARLRDERGLTAAIVGGRRYWISFLGLFLLELLLWMLVFVVFFVLVAFGALLGPLLFLVLPVALLFAFVSVLAIRAVFAFAPPSIVVDDQGAFAAIRSSVGFIRARPTHAAFYYVIAVGSFLALSTISGILAIFDVFAVGGLVSALVLFPVLDLLKTAFYSGYRETLSPPPFPDRSIGGQFVAGLRRGWNELVGFVIATPGTHAFVIGVGVVGFAMGWLASEPFLESFETSIAGRLEGHLPPTAALEFFANNWLVALTTAYAGFVLAIPALSSIWFNGLFIGVYGRLEAEPIELVAFIVPHGIVEIPAIFIAGALGVHLGLVGWRGMRGRADRATVATALERAFWVAIGLGILLAIAGFIEGFISPYYYRPFL